MSQNANASRPLSGRTIVLGIGGGIAAYKSAELVRLLRKAGAEVYVIMTAAAQRFITPLTLQTLSGHPVGTDLFDLTQESEIGHIALADRADLLLIAPATADLLARLSLGLADDLLTTLAMACRAPLLLAPAMNVHMWQKPQVEEHLARLCARGAEVVGPEPGELACGYTGTGRMSEPAVLLSRVEAICARTDPAPSLLGRRVVITAGPTYEALDPVRFLGNRSSGKMGFALAQAAARRGAEVVLISGPVALSTPAGVARKNVESAAEMAAAVLPFVDSQAGSQPADVIIMTAAVADFRPVSVAEQKIKKTSQEQTLELSLVPTLDILAELGRRRGPRSRPLLVGFAAETQDVEAYALRKLSQKRCDVIVANDVAEPGSGFGTDTNRVTLIMGPATHPHIERLPSLPKDEVAVRLWERLEPLLTPASSEARGEIPPGAPSHLGDET